MSLEETITNENWQRDDDDDDDDDGDRVESAGGGKERTDIFVGGRTLPAVSSSRVVRVTHSGYSTGNFWRRTVLDTSNVHAARSTSPVLIIPRVTFFPVCQHERG